MRCVVDTQSLIDDAELEEIQAAAEPLKDQVASGDYHAAFTTWDDIFRLVKQYSSHVDNYNFLVFEKETVPVKKRSLPENGQ